MFDTALVVPLRRLCLALLPLLAAACSGGGGSGSRQLPAEFSYPRGTLFEARGVAMESLVPSVKGRVDAWSVDPALPAGLALDPSSGVLAGTPAELAPEALYTVTATNAGGTTTAELSLSVVAPARFALTANGGDGSLSLFTVDALTGRLQPGGYALEAPGELAPRGVAAHPLGRAAYAIHAQSAQVSVFTVDAGSGRLERLRTLGTAWQPGEMVFHPLADVAYVLGRSSSFTMFAVDPASGDLAAMGAPVYAPSGPETAVISADGRFLYSADGAAGSVSAYAIDPATFVPALIGSLPSGITPVSVALSRDGRFLYALNLRSNRIDVFAVDPDTGLLSHRGNTPTGSLPAQLALAPTGRFLYVAVSGADRVETYSLDPASGAAMRVGVPLPAGDRPSAVALDPTGSFLYVAGQDSHDVSVFTVDPATGMLAPLDAARARALPGALALLTGDGPLAPSPRFAYAGARLSGDVAQYQVNAQSGALVEIAPAVLAGASTGAVALDPFGRFAYAINEGSGDVSTFQIDPATGRLTELLPRASAGGAPSSGAVDPSGRFLYVASAASGSLSVFAIDQASGGLTLAGSAALGGQPVNVVVEPAGRFAYVSDAASNGVRSLEIDPLSGLVTPVATPAPANGRPGDIALHPSGRWLYVALENVDLVAMYQIDPADGSLLVLGARVCGVQPRAVAVDPLGRFAYAANRDATGVGDISIFTVDQGGLLDGRGLIAAGVEPSAIEVDPSGRFVYATNEGTDDISVYAILGEEGMLQPRAPVPAGVAPSSIAILRTLL